MNRDHLEQLLRDAREVDRLEDALARPRLLPPWVGLLSAAAVVAMAAGLVIYGAMGPTPIQRGGQAAGGRTSSPAAPPQGHPRPRAGNVVLAIGDDGDGRLQCVRWSADALDGRPIDEVQQVELTKIGLSMACEPGLPRLLVVGLQGPQERLPKTDHEARQLAECLLRTPGCGTAAFDASTCARGGCAGDQVRMRVETVAMR